MAIAAGNPIVLNTPSPISLDRQYLLAEDSKTWKKGELCYLTSGTVTPVSGSTGGSTVYGIFAEDQATSTSTSSVWVYPLVVGMRLQMAVTNNGSDAAVSTANIGIGYDAYTASNISYLDVNGTTGAQFRVVDLYTALNAEQAAFQSHTDSSTPGIAIVEVASLAVT